MDCDSLRSAVARSFDTWAANHKKIYFTDVTDLCRNITGNECAAAEVLIFPDREFSAERNLARPTLLPNLTLAPKPNAYPNSLPNPNPNPNHIT